jgi:hypothetical protein
MPFTFSHPAIVLPLVKYKKWFSATGLIIGSITPDFEAFIRLNRPKIYSHTWLGIFWFDLPLAIILSLIFHSVVRDPLIDNLPGFLQQRFERCRKVVWIQYFKSHFLIVVCSMIIGITSHLLWDAFTHLNLASPDSSPVHSKYLSYDLVLRIGAMLQLFNSVLGATIIYWYIMEMPRTTVTGSSVHKWNYWIVIAIITFIVSLIEYVLTGPVRNIVTYVEISISSFLLALIITSLIYIRYSKEATKM